MNFEGIGYNEACVEILKFSQKTKLKLKRQESINFKNVGKLFENKSGNIEFQPISSFNFNSNSYGLTSFQISKLNNSSPKTNLSISSAAKPILSL